MLTRDEYKPRYNDYRQTNENQILSWYDGKGWWPIHQDALKCDKELGYEAVYQDENCTYYRVPITYRRSNTK